jgi:hypothetical protein
MHAPDAATILGWRGRHVRDAHGERLGKLGALYLEPGSDVPAWGGVRTGLLGRHESLVPLRGAREDDGDVVVGVTAEQVRTAPAIDPDGELTPGEEHTLDRHYGPAAQEPEGTLVRSEEEVHAGVERMRPAERVRLRKVLVTEHVTQEVPVRKEVVQLETEPPPPGTIESVEDVEER